MNPKAHHDSQTIWETAAGKGIEKYAKGQKEHQSQFWTAGASWYASQIEEEAIDLISYLHHLNIRLSSIRSIASMMRDEEITLHEAASLLEEVAGNTPPKKYQTPSKIRHHD